MTVPDGKETLRTVMAGSVGGTVTPGAAGPAGEGAAAASASSPGVKTMPSWASAVAANAVPPLKTATRRRNSRRGRHPAW